MGGTCGKPSRTIAWAKETFEALHPYNKPTGVYLNNLGTAEDGRMVHNVWGSNYERLVTAKRRYDPDTHFSGSNHND